MAIDRYLDQASLSPASRRVYRISLTSWAWPLVGRPAPPAASAAARGPPVVPLALLDEPATGVRLAAALTRRARHGRPDGQPRGVRAAQRGGLVAGPGLDQHGPDRRPAAPRPARLRGSAR